ncbi:hypothetical protein Aple_025220 [Acrocarpospora pleiomorpha]|uniref:Uncharacterized protein n=1 Tax=Acrocarpospora pleiomorpha TaxID=90975 RepID=A0A5M3XG49_9ACTN|nr:hypothetical protein [Acrocarpospora pleiomorpha]GES19626.1 hypothetical protein Aple_025220 [Acrocarpospora pleiomorpha]
MKPWHPYVDDPLFTAELILGHDALAADQVQRLTAFLEALAAHRGVIHTATAFNAVYFGYDLEYGGYVGGPIDFDDFPGVEPAMAPVGALVKLDAGSAPLYGEVLYKEGAHPALRADGETPDWLSGAPPGTAGPDPAAAPMDRLILDFDAFGPGVTVACERLDRLRHRGRVLDQFGHLILPSAPDHDDFVRYLTGPARRSLIRGPLPLLLSHDADDADLEAGVRSALQTLDKILQLAPGLRRWQRYAFPRAALAARLADGGELGGGDIRSIVSGLTQTPDRRRRFQPTKVISYTAIGSRIASIVRTRTTLTGMAYAAAVCHINTAVADVIRGETDERGLFPSGGHLRLDDSFQGGGIWRMSFPGGTHATIDPLRPLGLGWIGSLPPIPEQEPPLAEPVPDERLTISDSQVSWTVPVRLWQLREQVMPLPRLPEGERLPALLRLRLNHDGHQLEPEESDQNVLVVCDRDELRLTGICWPLEYFPGILLTFWWPRGAPTLNGTSTRLDVPRLVNGELLSHRYDPAIVTRDRAPSGAGLKERILRAVRHTGLVRPDGTALLPERALAPTVLEPSETDHALLAPALESLIAEGELSRANAGLTSDGQLVFPVGAEPSKIGVLLWRPAISTPTVRLGTYDVQSFLRRLPAGTQASEAKQAEYRELSERFGVGSELPPGFTLVSAHTRGVARGEEKHS